ncbi:hypothetical protein HJC23_005048 [Cyclotella cryptica]|uniref:Uncharacterized protein n=1 Tax=Cyclotella cryptica TaxID=29204 RepID=A0ABD3QDA4_9STRA|eukprot:CCRYP_006278-RA/>CCRYP_006278-RA protein AED:0.02 eAED:0.02 QI:124/1/1/1/0.6/0.5/6/925/1349
MSANQQDEAHLLASLGSTTAVASDYESSVLRDAQLRNAPQIALPPSTFQHYHQSSTSNSSLLPCRDGVDFPDLSDLAPSTERRAVGRASAVPSSSADVPHVLRVLSRTRDLITAVQRKPLSSFDGRDDSERDKNRKGEIDMLCMKEQILLSYLTNVAGLDERDELIPQGRLRQRIRGDHYNLSEIYYGKGPNSEDDGLDSSNNKRMKQSVSNTKKSRTHAIGSESSVTNRLDQIKNGENIDASIDNLLSDENASNPTTRHRRRTMMEMKSQMRIDSGLTPLKTMEEERFDAERSRKRREERRKRRLRRQRAALGVDDEDSHEDPEFDTGGVENEKKEAMTTVSILKTKQPKDASNDTCSKNAMNSPKENGASWNQGVKTVNDEIERDNVQNHAAKRKAVRWVQGGENGDEELSECKKTPVEKRTQTKVFCPICQIILTCSENDGDPDEFLSKHIEDCQNSRTRGGRTLRRRTKPSVVDIEDEIDDNIDDAGENELFVPKEVNSFDDDVHSDDNQPSQKAAAPMPIDDMDEFDYEDRVDEWVERGIERMRDMSERDSSEVPPGAVLYEGGLEIPAWINDRLFPYQRTGVRWMWELYCQGAGGVVGDEMGLGKTVQVSAFLGAMAANRFLDSALIIAPATMLSHWLSELAIWAPGLRRIMVHRSGEADGVSRIVSRGMLRSLQKWLKKARADRVNEAIDDKDFDERGANAFCGTGYAIVTTYENIRRSPDVWTCHDWSYVVLDEGQKIRNPDADVTLACKRLRTPNRLLMSGTPIQNDLRELWSLFDFIFPGRLGTLPAFEAEFAEPIKRGGYSNASSMQVQLAYRCALVLRDLINPYLLRRQKKDVKEVNRMPSKTEQVLFCRLSSKQRSLYQEYLSSDEVMGVMRGSVQLLKAVTMLRKICNHPDLVVGPDGALDSVFQEESSSDEDDGDAMFDEDQLVERAGKLHVLSKILPLWQEQGHRVIIFCQWRKMLNIIERFTRQQGWKFARLDGNTNIASRQKLVDKFNQDTSYFIMLMTTRTGGVGLNVTGANRVLLYDPDWNPQTDAQARERAWRFGQKKDVTVYRLITAGTIEEKIYQRQIFKTALTNQILQDPKQRRLFSQKDLKDLFTLKDDSTDTTETGKLTRGRGVVDVDVSEQCNSSDQSQENAEDNGETLELVLKSKGLCGVFDHDFVENSSSNKKPSQLEMEENAKKVAQKAVLTLKASSDNIDRFVPTWTGSDETKQNCSDFDSSFGGASSAGMPNGNAPCRNMTSSSAMLAQLRNKRMEISSSARPLQNSSSNASAEDKKYSALLLRLQKYIKRMNSAGKGPTTKDLLNEFKDVPDCDAAIFRSMLKSVAVVKSGRWIMQ